MPFLPAAVPLCPLSPPPTPLPAVQRHHHRIGGTFNNEKQK